MNPLTQIRNTQLSTKREIELGLDERGSWHDHYKHSAYIYAGGLPYQLTEGDILAVFSQYGEIVDVNLVRDPKTKKSKGFAFLAYEDQRSTVLAVDNLSGSRVAGRVIRVEHVGNYKRKKAEVEAQLGAPVANEEQGARPKQQPDELPETKTVAGTPSFTEQEKSALVQDQISKGSSAPSWRELVAKREATLKAKEDHNGKPTNEKRRTEKKDKKPGTGSQPRDYARDGKNSREGKRDKKEKWKA